MRRWRAGFNQFVQGMEKTKSDCNGYRNPTNMKKRVIIHHILNQFNIIILSQIQDMHPSENYKTKIHNLN